MMNQGGNTETVAPVDPGLLENRHIGDGNQMMMSTHLPSTSAPEAMSWTNQKVDGSSNENGLLTNSSYPYNHQVHLPARTVQDGLNVSSVACSSSSFVTSNAPQDYNAYAPYSNSTDPYGYASTGYQGYYNNYQQQPNQSYSQPVGAYQNTGAPYQPLSSFQNTGFYAGSTSYSTTYYNPGDYQTAGGYQTSSYSNQTPSWNGGNYGNYASHQYAQYTPDTSAAYSSSSTNANSLHYQQQYKQWADYYSQTEVSCAPGTEKLSAPGTANAANAGYSTSSTSYPAPNSQPPPSYTPAWRPESGSSEPVSAQPGAVSSGNHDGYWTNGAPNSQGHLTNATQPHFQKPLDLKNSYDSFQDQLKSAGPQGPNLQYPAHLATQSYQLPSQSVPSSEARRPKLQIPTNPRIATNLSFSVPKTSKDSSAADVVVQPAYISVSLPKPNDKELSNDSSESILKPGMFPNSLRGYVERALARCKDEKQTTSCQSVLKEMITKATVDGTLYTKDWDIEPLFQLPNGDAVNTDNLQSSTPISSLPKYKRSPSRRSKSRWEPLPEEKPPEAPAPDATKYGGWVNVNERDKKILTGNSENKDLSKSRFPLWDQRTVGKTSQGPPKKQRLADAFSAPDNGEASSDSDKEQSLTAYYSGAMALANSPEERKKRESRSKRFDRGHGRRAENNHFKPKNAGTENLYTRRANALVHGKDLENGGCRAVEDIDWDALTVKGTCQEIEKRYLRLTSAPDPGSVRPEDVLEKALNMVQMSQKNYLYKCDQLKSIRQDLTVQRIINHLTVKVYETHARLAIEFGDLPEYNQCLSQLKTLYAEGIEGCHMEFAAYNLLCVILNSNNKRDLLSSMSRLSDEAKKDVAVNHALAVRAAVTSGNYVKFFRLYKEAPNLNTCLMDPYAEKMRYKAVTCMSRSYRPSIPVSYIAQILGFCTSSVDEVRDKDKHMDGLEECIEWLKVHGACFITDNVGEMQFDTKASSTTLYMPEPEDAVAHGDANLAVNDFFTRTATPL